MRLHENPLLFKEAIVSAAQPISPLIVDLHATWQLLQPTYLNELPDLAYRDIPSVDAIEEDISTLLALITSE